MTSISNKLFRLTLLVYPREFRREYGAQMTQLFRDCGRQPAHTGLAGTLSLWLNMLEDLIISAPREHLAKLQKENSTMNNRRRNLFTAIVCLVIIAAAFFLLSYARSHEVTSILLMGKLLDALVTAGVVGNLVIFLLKLTNLNPIKTVLWTMLFVNLLLLILALTIGNRVDPSFNPISLIVAYGGSFLTWLALHWIFAQREPPINSPA